MVVFFKVGKVIPGQHEFRGEDMKFPRIKKCPFCGGNATLFKNASERRWCTNYYVRVRCEVCESQGKSFRGTTDPADENWESYECYQAICAWNMRTKEEEETNPNQS